MQKVYEKALLDVIRYIFPHLAVKNQWILHVVSNDVDTTDPNLHIGYHTLILICILVAQWVYIHGIQSISGD